MGADFLMAVADITKTNQHWYNILGELDDGAMREYIEHYGYPWFDDDDGDSQYYQDVAERISKAITVVYDGDTREGAWFTDGDKTWFVTGGMSWGDYPTDIFDDVCIVDSFQQYAHERKDV